MKSTLRKKKKKRLIVCKVHFIETNEASSENCGEIFLASLVNFCNTIQADDPPSQEGDGLGVVISEVGQIKGLTLKEWKSISIHPVNWPLKIGRAHV